MWINQSELGDCGLNVDCFQVIGNDGYPVVGYVNIYF